MAEIIQRELFVSGKVVGYEYGGRLVRCKDCICYGDHGDGEMACAMMILYPNKPTDYCSLGERREVD